MARLNQIRGLHHVTSLAQSARQNNAFFTHALGLRRVKKTVNFDAPDVYHLYYGDEKGSPGGVMTYHDPVEDLSPEEAKKVVGGSGAVAPKVVVASEPATPHIPTPNPPKG